MKPLMHRRPTLAAVIRARLTPFVSKQALRAAHDLGRIASTQDGGMLYTQVAKETTFPLEGLEVAGINSVVKGDTISVTLCGSHQAIEAWLAKDKRAVRINSATPWHHSSYAHVPEAFLPMASSTASGCCRMVSTTGGGQLIQQSLCQEHWKAWISSKTDLPGALYAVAHTLQMGPTSPPVVVIECGSHPIARSAAQKLLNPKVHVASSHRGASAEAQIREARSALATAGVFADGFASAVKAAFPEIDYNTGFAEQGIDSQQQVMILHLISN